MLLALSALAHGTLLLARTEEATSRAAARVLRERALGDAALAAAVRAGPPRGSDTLVTWAALEGRVVALDGTSMTARWWRLGPESWLVTAGVEAGRRAENGRLVWALDPLTRVRSVEAVLTVGGGSAPSIDGSIDGSAALAPDSLLSADCAALQDDASLRPGGWPAVLVTPDPEAPPLLGLLSLDALSVRIPVRVEGSGTPRPVEVAGRCDPADPWNWGAPGGSLSDCAEHFALRAAVGDLSVEGGEGQGLLSVDGDLTLTAGARFHGVVVVSGRLVLASGATLHGFAIAGGGAQIGSDARVLGSACWALKALEAARSDLGRPVTVPGGERVGPA